jgi:hypothetical protein
MGRGGRGNRGMRRRACAGESRYEAEQLRGTERCAMCAVRCAMRAVLTLRAGGVGVRVRVEVSPLRVDVSDTDDGSEADVYTRQRELVDS